MSGSRPDALGPVECARPCHARLHFVRDEDCSGLPAALVQRLGELRPSLPQPAFPLDHLDDDAGERVIEHPLERLARRCTAPRRHLARSGWKGSWYFAATACRKAAPKVLPWKRAREAEQLLVAGTLGAQRVQPRVLQRRLVGLGAAVAEKDRGELVRSLCQHEPRQGECRAPW